MALQADAEAAVQAGHQVLRTDKICCLFCTEYLLYIPYLWTEYVAYPSLFKGGGDPRKADKSG